MSLIEGFYDLTEKSIEVSEDVLMLTSSFLFVFSYLLVFPNYYY